MLGGNLLFGDRRVAGCRVAGCRLPVAGCRVTKLPELLLRLKLKLIFEVISLPVASCRVAGCRLPGYQVAGIAIEIEIEIEIEIDF